MWKWFGHTLGLVNVIALNLSAGVVCRWVEEADELLGE